MSSFLKRVVCLGLSTMVLLFISFTVKAAESSQDTDETVYCSDAEEISKGATNFNTGKVYKMFYDNIKKDNSSMDPRLISRLATELTSRAEAAEIESRLSSSGTVKNGNNAQRVVVELGQISGNNLVTSAITDYVPDSQTTIISESWSVNPHLKSRVRDVKCTEIWFGMDNYKTNASGTFSQGSTISVSATLGFSQSLGAKLTRKVALDFGFTVSTALSISASLNSGYTMNVPGWTKCMVRPYIIWYTDQLEGTYCYYTYNYFNQKYYYVYEVQTATSKYATEYGVRSWSRTNIAQNPNAQSPEPPIKWED